LDGVSFKSRPILWSIAGDTGEGACDWFKFLLMKDVQLPHLKILFPTAPERPYTPLGGEVRECYWKDNIREDWVKVLMPYL
jgi:hypothetical protein